MKLWLGKAPPEILNSADEIFFILAFQLEITTKPEGFLLLPQHKASLFDSAFQTFHPGEFPEERIARLSDALCNPAQILSDL